MKKILQTKRRFLIFILLQIIVIITLIVLISHIDIIPATENDYDMLMDQAIDISKNPKLLFELNSNAKFEDNIFYVALENDECAIIFGYDEDFRIISCVKKDKAIPSSLFIDLSFIFYLYITIIIFIVIEEVKKFK